MECSMGFSRTHRNSADHMPRCERFRTSKRGWEVTVGLGLRNGLLKRPHTEEWMRTFCIITTTANDLVGQIHDCTPVILPHDAYDRWLANIEPDPRDLLVPFPSELMKIWPISTVTNLRMMTKPSCPPVRSKRLVTYCEWLRNCASGASN